ncbi:CHAD domain-containing protein [Streptomyces sp. M10(2022)]
MLKDYGRLATRIGHALEQPPGQDRDLAMHEARKAAKRARYAGEAARPALGKPAKRFAERMKAVQQVLGDHQDSVVARDALRAIAVQAHAAGSPRSAGGCCTDRRKRRRQAGSGTARSVGKGVGTGRSGGSEGLSTGVGWMVTPASPVCPCQLTKVPRCLPSRSSHSSKLCSRMCRSPSSTWAVS